MPRVAAITAATTVDFPNDDPIVHNVFSLSRGATFDLGRYPRGDTKSCRFDRPGVVKVFCHLHSHRTALLRVFDHPYFARLDARGRFTMPDLPPGRHRVVAWPERVGEVAHEALVTNAGMLAVVAWARCAHGAGRFRPAGDRPSDRALRHLDPSLVVIGSPGCAGVTRCTQ